MKDRIVFVQFNKERIHDIIKFQLEFMVGRYPCYAICSNKLTIFITIH
jgi:hypothetical protein